MTLTPRLSRLLAVALLVVAVALPYNLIVRPIAEAHIRYSDEIEEQTRLLSRLKHAAQSLDELSAQRERLESQPFLQTAYLSGSSEALAGAELQNRIKGIVEQAGGVLNSTQILPSQRSGAFRKLTVRVQMTGDMDAVYQIAYDLEAAEPFLFFDNVDITSRAQRRRRGQTADTVSPELRVRFDVYGYMREGG